MYIHIEQRRYQMYDNTHRHIHTRTQKDTCMYHAVCETTIENGKYQLQGIVCPTWN